MGLGTLRRHHDGPDPAPVIGAVSGADGGEMGKSDLKAVEALKTAGLGVGITQGKKTRQKAGATAGNGGSE